MFDWLYYRIAPVLFVVLLIAGTLLVTVQDRFKNGCEDLCNSEDKVVDFCDTAKKICVCK
jgi:hypothetical protein